MNSAKVVMDAMNWLRQGEMPLYENILWSRPESRIRGGKLLIIGGNSQSFAAPAKAYAESVKAGAGTVKALVPDTIKKHVKLILSDTEFAPSTPIGSFAKSGLSHLLELSDWSDGVLLAGDLGKNSETAILLESYVAKYMSRLTITKDALDYFTAQPSLVANRPNTLLVASTAQLQKLTINLRIGIAITFGMDLMQLVNALHYLTNKLPIYIVTSHQQSLLVAVAGKVSSTKFVEEKPVWRVEVASISSVFWLQNQKTPFEALTTAAYTIIHKNKSEI